MSFAAQSSMGRSMGRSRLDQSFGASSVRRTGTSGRSKGGARKAKDGGDGPRKLVADPAHPNLVVWDGMRDATPLSLVRTVVGVIAPSDAGMTASSQAISMSGGELAKSGGLTTSMQESLAPSISTSMREGEGSFSDMPGGGSAQHAAGATAEPVPAWSAAGRRADDALTDDEDAVPLTDAELAAPVTILLTETPTFFWLDIEGDVVGKDVQAEHAKTLADNERFRAVQQSRAVASENYSERAAQTFSNEPKVRAPGRPLRFAYSVRSCRCMRLVAAVELWRGLSAFSRRCAPAIRLLHCHPPPSPFLIPRASAPPAWPACLLLPLASAGEGDDDSSVAHLVDGLPGAPPRD